MAIDDRPDMNCWTDDDGKIYFWSGGVVKRWDVSGASVTLDQTYSNSADGAGHMVSLTRFASFDINPYAALQRERRSSRANLSRKAIACVKRPGPSEIAVLGTPSQV